MKNRKTAKNGGFTLIEVIVATMIIVVAAVPLLGAFVTSHKMNMKGRITEQAMTVAENTVESIKALGAVTTLDWVENGGGTSFDVVKNSASATKAATPEIVYKDNASKKVLLSDGKTEVNVSDFLEFNFTITDVYMGKSYYDVYVQVKLDTSEDTNVLAYASEDKYEEAGMKIMKFYTVKAYTFAKGTITSGVVPSDLGKAIAKYSGTFVTKD